MRAWIHFFCVLYTSAINYDSKLKEDQNIQISLNSLRRHLSST